MKFDTGSFRDRVEEVNGDADRLAVFIVTVRRLVCYPDPDRVILLQPSASLGSKFNRALLFRKVTPFCDDGMNLFF